MLSIAPVVKTSCRRLGGQTTFSASNRVKLHLPSAMKNRVLCHTMLRDQDHTVCLKAAVFLSLHVIGDLSTAAGEIHDLCCDE